MTVFHATLSSQQWLSNLTQKWVIWSNFIWGPTWLDDRAMETALDDNQSNEGIFSHSVTQGTLINRTEIKTQLNLKIQNWISGAYEKQLNFSAFSESTHNIAGAAENVDGTLNLNFNKPLKTPAE